MRAAGSFAAAGRGHLTVSDAVFSACAGKGPPACNQHRFLCDHSFARPASMPASCCWAPHLGHHGRLAFQQWMGKQEGSLRVASCRPPPAPPKCPAALSWTGAEGGCLALDIKHALEGPDGVGGGADCGVMQEPATRAWWGGVKDSRPPPPPPNSRFALPPSACYNLFTLKACLHRRPADARCEPTSACHSTSKYRLERCRCTFAVTPKWRLSPNRPAAGGPRAVEPAWPAPSRACPRIAKLPWRGGLCLLRAVPRAGTRPHQRWPPPAPAPLLPAGPDRAGCCPCLCRGELLPGSPLAAPRRQLAQPHVPLSAPYRRPRRAPCPPTSPLSPQSPRSPPPRTAPQLLTGSLPNL